MMQGTMFELPEPEVLVVEPEGKSPVPKLTASFIVQALTRFYLERLTNPESWVVLPELRGGTGYGERQWEIEGGRYKLRSDAIEQRIDVWVMNLWGKQERVAYEIKISRSDFLHELKQPKKREYALSVSNRFYFAVPHGLVRPAELPPEAGLIEVLDGGRVYTKIKAPWRDTDAPSWRFVASALRRAHRIGRLRGEEPGGMK